MGPTDYTGKFEQYIEQFWEDERGAALGEGPPFPFSLDSEMKFEFEGRYQTGFLEIAQDN